MSSCLIIAKYTSVQHMPGTFLAFLPQHTRTFLLPFGYAINLCIVWHQKPGNISTWRTSLSSILLVVFVLWTNICPAPANFLVEISHRVILNPQILYVLFYAGFYSQLPFLSRTHTLLLHSWNFRQSSGLLVSLWFALFLVVLWRMRGSLPWRNQGQESW